MRGYKIFYSWQSDNKQSRNAVRTALKKACEKFSNEGISISIVQGPGEDANGMTKIDDAVLKNISECDIFICDLTPVAKYGEKLMPNSNVLIEMGYALAIKGQNYMIGVANLQGNDASHMPFDIRQMRIGYYSKVADLNFYQWISPILRMIDITSEERSKAFDCKISDISGNFEIQCYPIFLKTNYIAKNTQEDIIKEDRSALAYPYSLGLTLPSQLFGKSRILESKTNRSFCVISLFLNNSGSKALQNCKLIITADNNQVTFTKTNIKNYMSYVPDNLYIYQSVEDGEVSESFPSPINPTATEPICDFYVSAPHHIKSFNLLWKLESLECPLEGEINVQWNVNIIEENIYLKSDDKLVGTTKISNYIEEKYK